MSEEADPGEGVEASVATDSGDEMSIIDLAQQPIVLDWTKFVAGLFALIGIGFGLVAILWFDVIEESIWDTGGIGLVGAMGGTPVDFIPFFAVIIGVFLGAHLGQTLAADDKTTFLAAGISSLVGTIVALVLGAVMVSFAFNGLDVAFGDLLVVGIVSGIVVAIVAVGGVWLARNQGPA